MSDRGASSQPRAAGRAVRRLLVWSRHNARALVALGASVLACLLLALVAYQLALARVPQHRAALETFIQGQTGFEVRFATLRVGLGWHGPEAVFSRIELLDVRERRPVVRAPRLTVAFDTWRILRNGQVQAARITLADPEIDITPLVQNARRRTRGAAREQNALLERMRLLERLPMLRVDVEGGTLRVPPEQAGQPPFSLRIRSATLRRAEEQTHATTSVLLPNDLGRTLYVSLRVDGPLRELERTSGQLRIVGRSLAFGAWREIASLGRFTPAAGAGDLTARIDWEQGRLQEASGRIDARGLAWRVPESSDVVRFARARGALSAERRGESLRLRLEDFEIEESQGRGGPASLRVDLVDGGRRASGDVPEISLSAALAIARAGGLAPAILPLGLETVGRARDVSFAWNADAPAGERLKLEAALADVALVSGHSLASVAGIAATLTASDTRATVRAVGSEVRMGLPAVFARLPEPLALEADLEWAREPEGWRLSSERIHLSHPSVSVALSGALSAARPTAGGTASELAAASTPASPAAGSGDSRLELSTVLERVDAARLRESIVLHERWPTLAALLQSIEAGELTDGRLALTASVDARTLDVEQVALEGEFGAQGVALASGSHWPAARGVAGRLSLGGDASRLVLSAGETEGLNLARAEGAWDAASGALRSFEAELSGPAERARAGLAGHEALRERLGALAALDVIGPAEMFVTVEAGARPGSPARWLLATELEQARLALAGLPPFESLEGRVTVEEGQIRTAELSGRWLDGPVRLWSAPLRTRAPADLALAAEGKAPAARFASALGLDPTGLEAELTWQAALRREPPRARRPGAWRVEFASRLAEGSPGVRGARQWGFDPQLPLRAQLDLPDEGAGALRLEAFGLIDARAMLERQEDAWTVERAGVRVGGGPARLPVAARVEVVGELDRVDALASLGLWPQLASSLHRPGTIDLGTGRLVLAGHDLGNARLTGGFDGAGLHLVVAAQRAAGSIDWPREVSEASPLELGLARLSVAEADTDSGELLAALGASAATRLTIDDFSWGAMRFGKLSAQLASDGERLRISELALQSAALQATGDGTCTLQPRRCEGALQASSGDLAAALRDLGFAPDLRAAQATLDARLLWQPAAERSGWAALEGRIETELSDGAVEPAEVVGAGRPFAPLAAVASLVRVARAPEPTTAVTPTAPASAPFSALTASFELGGAELRTADLRLLAPTHELSFSGRLELADRRYEGEALYVSGAADVRSALRRVGAERSLAAALRAAREIVASRPERSERVQLQLGGTWDSPTVERKRVD